MSSNIFSEKYIIINDDISNSNTIKISRLFDLLHETANHSLVDKKMDVDSLIKRNLLWVLAEQCAEINKLPTLGETIITRTWVGKEFSTFIPRFYEVENDSGEIILKASSIWTILDKNERKAKVPSSVNVAIPMKTTGSEIKYLCTPKSIPQNEEMNFTIVKDYIDKNGHMHNTKYFDIIDSWYDIIINNQIPSKIIARYSKEAFLNDILTIKKGAEDNSIFYTINSEKGNHLKLRIDY